MPSTDYCTVTDVERLMFANQYTFDENTPMTATDVQKYINTAEDRVDEITRDQWRIKTQDTILKTVQAIVDMGDATTDYYAAFKLMHRPVDTVNKLEIFVASEDSSSNQEGYEDITADQGRNKEWFIDKKRGIVYLRAGFMPYIKRNGARIKYTFGRSTVEPQIRDATAMLAAWFLLQSEDFSLLLPEGTEHLRVAEKAQQWKQNAMEILNVRRRTLVWS